MMEKPYDLIDGFVYMQGQKDVPKLLYEYAALSAIAACVQDRVTVALDPTQPISLNMYIMLIAPSGVGKGRAISALLDLLREVCDGTETQSWYRLAILSGQSTRAAFEDTLAEQRDPEQTTVKHAKAYWLLEELVDCLGSEKLVKETIRFLTALYERTPIPMVRQTRGHGKLLIEDACVNVLAGTTWDWINGALDKADIAGGFFRRMILMEADVDYDNLKFDEFRPDDHQEVRDNLVRRFRRLIDADVTFNIGMQDDVLLAMRDWHERSNAELPKPIDAGTRAVYNGKKVMTLKLAALSALARWDETATMMPPTIQRVDFDRAVRWWMRSYDLIPKASLNIGGSLTAKNVDVVYQAFKSECSKTRPYLTKVELHHIVYKNGLVKDDVDRAVATLLDGEWLQMKQLPSGGYVYVWTGKKR